MAFLPYYNPRTSDRSKLPKPVLFAVCSILLVSYGYWKGGVLGTYAIRAWDWHECKAGLAGGFVVYEEAERCKPFGGQQCSVVRTDFGECCFVKNPVFWSRTIQATLHYEGPPDTNCVIVFLGQLKEPSGQTRIVSIGRPVRGRGHSALTDGFRSYILSKPSAFAEPTAIFARLNAANARRDGTCNYAKDMKLYSGYRDPQDPSHAIVDYDINSIRGHIDIWLRDTQSIEMAFRDGPGKEDGTFRTGKRDNVRRNGKTGQPLMPST
jgi:hypothetical protein